MEHHKTIVTETSLLNHFKIYKNVQITDAFGEKLIKVLVENKTSEFADWRELVERFSQSEHSQIREWALPIKTYCERYEALVQDVEANQYAELSKTFESYEEMNERTDKTRQSLMRNYPCVEWKYQLKNGQVQMSEVIYNEKLLAEIGHSIETFSSSVFQEGLPKLITFESECGSMGAKLRLDKFLVMEKDGFQSEDFETCLIMKSGYMKKVKLRAHYHTNYEKGILGFSVFGTLTARQKANLDLTKSAEDKMSIDYIKLMSNREQEMVKFLSTFYNIAPEQRYSNLDRVCQIKELRELRNEQTTF